MFWSKVIDELRSKNIDTWDDAKRFIEKHYKKLIKKSGNILGWENSFSCAARRLGYKMTDKYHINHEERHQRKEKERNQKEDEDQRKESKRTGYDILPSWTQIIDELRRNKLSKWADVEAYVEERHQAKINSCEAQTGWRAAMLKSAHRCSFKVTCRPHKRKGKKVAKKDQDKAENKDQDKDQDKDREDEDQDASDDEAYDGEDVDDDVDEEEEKEEEEDDDLGLAQGRHDELSDEEDSKEKINCKVEAPDEYEPPFLLDLDNIDEQRPLELGCSSSLSEDAPLTPHQPGRNTAEGVATTLNRSPKRRVQEIHCNQRESAHRKASHWEARAIQAERQISELRHQVKMAELQNSHLRDSMSWVEKERDRFEKERDKLAKKVQKLKNKK
eukprot:TRINITY_DN16303_c0_g1_i1.p1 TRINITY_DN16303_c0_g1~~TRINITY_DN16303_c0_g1_i1.p1  ORF type:complete len:415 (-),score=112.51 TRINITY_DN16303_c0_g1_i1:37-1197(-)